MKDRDIAQKYWWVYNHHKLMTLPGRYPMIVIEPHMVNPITNRIEGDYTLNTQIAYWIELFVVGLTDEFKDDNIDNLWHITNDMTESCHEWELDCGGWTADEAIEKMYDNVLEKYGDYEENLSIFDIYPLTSRNNINLEI